MNRRTVLATLGATSITPIAGCAGVLDEEGDDSDPADGNDTEPEDGAEIDGPELPLVEDPPEAVYIPTHREGMVMPDPIAVGELMVGPMITYPHPFWLVSGDSAELVEVTESDAIHLMATIWDPETGTVIPTDEGLSIEVRKDGEVIDSRAPWTMLSQTMGAHFGDNVPLDGQGTYEVEVTVPAIETRKTGDLDGRFDSSHKATFEFTFDSELMETIVDMIMWVDEEHWGSTGAIDPGHDDHDDGHEHNGDGHDHGEDGHDQHGDDRDDGHHHTSVPFSALPMSDHLPGTYQDTAISGDADFVVSVVGESGRFTDEVPYLLISPRTPYNRVPLPDMAISVEIVRDGESVIQTSLVETLDHEAGHHYGATLPELQPGDELTIVVDTPPQTARHQGYETAFVNMSPMVITLDEW